MSRKRRKIVSETQLERTEDSDLPNAEEKNLPDAKKSNSGLQPKYKHNDLGATVSARQVEFYSMVVAQTNDHWLALLRCQQTAAIYQRKLPNEYLLTEGMRHFILWNLYPKTKTVSDFTTTLDPRIAMFFDQIQQGITESGNSFESLKQVVGREFDAVAQLLPPKFDSIIFKLWDNLNIYTIAKSKNSGALKLDLEKNLNSVIDSLMLRTFCIKSNREIEENEIRPDFQVFQKIGGVEYTLLIGEDEYANHTAIDHEDSYKLFEFSRCNQHRFATLGFTNITTFGILNGGNGLTLFEFTCEESPKRYNVCWIRDAEDVTFVFDFAHFATILKVLVALYNSMTATEARIKHLLAHPEELVAGQTSSDPTQNSYFGEEESDSRQRPQLSDNADSEEYQDDDSGAHEKVDLDKDFKFNELFPVDSILLGLPVQQNPRFRHLRTVNLLPYRVAKWSWARGRSVPYEVEIIAKFPLWTVPQPLQWASVDDNKYHVIVFHEHAHGPVTALKKFRQHAFDLISTLQFIHERGYVHGDIKLENTLCDFEDETFHLIDYDHTCKISEVSLHRFGTKGHRAPEYLLNEEYSIAAEMFSLGVWLIEWFFQKPVQSILTKFRPNFSLASDEINAVDLLLEVFEEYAESKQFSEMWAHHFRTVDVHADFAEPNEEQFNETQFQHLRVMVRDLLSKDPSQRPSCKDLLTNSKYNLFLDTSRVENLIIPRKERTKAEEHVIWSPKYAMPERLSKENGEAKVRKGDRR